MNFRINNETMIFFLIDNIFLFNSVYLVVLSSRLLSTMHANRQLHVLAVEDHFSGGNLAVASK